MAFYTWNNLPAHIGLIAKSKVDLIACGGGILLGQADVKGSQSFMVTIIFVKKILCTHSLNYACPTGFWPK